MARVSKQWTPQEDVILDMARSTINGNNYQIALQIKSKLPCRTIQAIATRLYARYGIKEAVAPIPLSE